MNVLNFEQQIGSTVLAERDKANAIDTLQKNVLIPVWDQDP